VGGKSLRQAENVYRYPVHKLRKERKRKGEESTSFEGGRKGGGGKSFKSNLRKEKKRDFSLFDFSGGGGHLSSLEERKETLRDNMCGVGLEKEEKGIF